MAHWAERIWCIKDNPPAEADAFIIPSYALVDRTRPTRPTRAQIDLAIDWWRRFPQAIIIMSTGDNQGLGLPNSRVMVEYAAARGVPRQSLVEEDRSLTTYQNLLFSRRICDERGLRQPTLVTIDLYTRRAVATSIKLGWSEVRWLSVYAQGESAFGYKWLQTHSRLTIFCYEVAAMALSKVVGWA
jgi:vancomycin permeability regulator SanA